MTVVQKRKIIERIATIEESLDILKQARIDAITNGFASATISTGGGSKSYSRFSPEQFTYVINELLKELTQLKGLLTTGTAKPIKTIVTIYS